MTEEIRRIEEVFKLFVEGTLVEHTPEKSLSVISDDVIGIGMGNQGIVADKSDIRRILEDGKVDAEDSETSVSYERILVRCYEERFGTICGVLRIKTTVKGETVESSLGQMMSVRKENGDWRVYAIQATPLFDEIEEMEAYPLKFAENALEKYRQQEQIAKDAQRDSVAIYRVNFTKGIFEESILKNDVVISTEAGESYEKTMFKSAWRHLNEEECYRFISTFSMGNILNMYHSGQTELSMRYEMILSKEKSIWMKSVLRLYMDKADGDLKGYMYVFDIDREMRKEIELQKKVERDSMTDLYHKKYAGLRIGERLKHISLADPGAFFMIDLDRFKNVNDTYGHQKGDQVIQAAAECIRGLTQKNDIVGRLGGDEFCVYFHGGMTLEMIREKAEAICGGIRSIIPGGAAKTSCSIGIVVCASANTTFEEIYQKADQALYEQKERGRDGYTVYHGES